MVLVIQTLWSAMIIGFGLGMEHALDSDHVIAVSAILSIKLIFLPSHHGSISEGARQRVQPRG